MFAGDVPGNRFMRRIFRRRLFQVALIAANVLLVAWVIRSYNFSFLDVTRNVVFDQYQRLKPRDTPPLPVRVVDIDDESVRALGQWPWPRSRIALLVDRLAELGAAVIAFDMVFSEPDRTSPATLIEELEAGGESIDEELAAKLASLPDNDHALANSLKKAPTIIGFFGSRKPNDIRPLSGAGFVFAGSDPKKSLVFMEGSIVSLPLLQEAATGVASVSLTGGRTSDVIRRVPLFLTDGDNIYPTLSMEALRIATGASTYVLKTTEASGEISAGTSAVVAAKVGDFVIPTTASGELQLYYGYDNPDDYVSADRLISPDYRDLAPLIDGHIVFVGTSAVGLSDLRVTSLGQTVPGVSLHAQLIKQVVTGNYLQRPDWADGAEMAMAVVITLLMMMVLPFTGAFVSALFGAFCAAGVAAVSWYAFDHYGVLIEPLFAMLTGGAVYLVSVTLTFAATERERRFIRSAFQQYLSPTLMKKLEAFPEQLVLGGEIRSITMMFLDVRNFTGISEKLKPTELVAFINELFSPLSEIVQDREGAIDKYIGDSIMAFWNAPLDVPEHERKACRAALEMVEAVEKMNRDDAFGFRRNSIDIPDIQIGIGINSGETCVGNMGSSSRFDYSVVGDTVNIASRIESETKNFGWPILVSGAIPEAVPDMAFLSVGNLLLKGKSEGIDIHALVGDEKYADTEEFERLRQHHAHLLDALDRGNASEIADAVHQCALLAPDRLKPLYEVLSKRSPHRKRQRMTVH